MRSGAWLPDDLDNCEDDSADESPDDGLFEDTGEDMSDGALGEDESDDEEL